MDFLFQKEDLAFLAIGELYIRPLFSDARTLLEQNDELAPERSYMTLETLAKVGDNPNVSLSAVTV